MGQQWKKMRRILITNLFSQSKLQWLLQKRNIEADNLMKFLYSQCSNSENGSVVNVRTAAQHYSANVMRRMFFNSNYFGKGREDGGPGPEEERHVSALFTVVLHVYAFCVSDYLPWLKPLRDALKTINQYQDPIIDERIGKRRTSLMF